MDNLNNIQLADTVESDKKADQVVDIPPDEGDDESEVEAVVDPWYIVIKKWILKIFIIDWLIGAVKKDDSPLFHIVMWNCAAAIFGIILALLLIKLSMLGVKPKSIPPESQFSIYLMQDDSPITNETKVTRFDFYKELFATNVAADYTCKYYDTDLLTFTSIEQEENFDCFVRALNNGDSGTDQKQDAGDIAEMNYFIGNVKVFGGYPDFLKDELGRDGGDSHFGYYSPMSYYKIGPPQSNVTKKEKEIYVNKTVIETNLNGCHLIGGGKESSIKLDIVVMKALSRLNQTTSIPIVKRYGDRGTHDYLQSDSTAPKYTGCWHVLMREVERKVTPGHVVCTKEIPYSEAILNNYKLETFVPRICDKRIIPDHQKWPQPQSSE